MNKPFGSNLSFDDSLEKGKNFEDIVEPIINNYFANIDPNSYYMNKAYSKKDIKMGRGQRYKLCADPTHSMSAPDVEVHSLGKQLHVEIKLKNKWINWQGKQYAIIDEYRVGHYKNVLDITNFDACLIVFGEQLSKQVYITNVNSHEIIHLPFMRTDFGNKGCMFACWEVNKMKHIGSF